MTGVGCGDWVGAGLADGGMVVGVGVGSGVWLCEQADVSAIMAMSKDMASDRAAVLRHGSETRSNDVTGSGEFDPCRAVAAALSGFGAEVSDGAVALEVFADDVSERAGSPAVYDSELGQAVAHGVVEEFVEP